jgi:hypothetical protein
MKPELLKAAGLVVVAVMCLTPGLALANGEHEHEGPGLARLIAPMGILTFSLLVATFVTGWFVPKKRRVLLKVHLSLAVITVASGLFHGGLVLLLF